MSQQNLLKSSKLVEVSELKFLTTEFIVHDIWVCI